MSENDILALVEGFKKCTLPSAHWTHEAHLITGLWFNYYHSHLEALCYLRSGIISYNVSTGEENTPEKGYHETLTIFWNKVLSRYVDFYQKKTLEQLSKSFLESEWSSKELPFKYYRRDTLFSLKARATWVEPDVMKLEERFSF